MVRLFDRIRRDGLMSSENSALASTALTDIREDLPMFVVDNAVELWFEDASLRPHRDKMMLMPYVPALFVEGRIPRKTRDILRVEGLVPDDIGMIALRTDLWNGVSGTPEEKGMTTADFVTQQIASSPMGGLIPIAERAPIDPVRWMVDYHLFCFEPLAMHRPTGPVATITAFLTSSGVPARNMDQKPMLLSLFASISVELEKSAIFWLEALWFGVALGWCQNMTLIQTETDEKLSRAFQKRHKYLLGDPIVLLPFIDDALRDDVNANKKPELSPTRMAIPTGEFEIREGTCWWVADPVEDVVNSPG